MSYTVDRAVVVEHTLVAAVADDGTFTVSYPTGYAQADFNAGLAGTGYVIVDGNDRWSEADPGFSFSFGASDITVTNLTGASLAAGTELLIQFDQVDGNQKINMTIPVFAMSGIANGDVVTGIRPGVYGWLENIEWHQGVPVTTAAKAASINAEIDGTNVTGGVVALTSAACTPLGAVIQGSRITANNYLTPESLLDIEASSVTAFVEGSGFFILRIRLDPAYATS